MKKKTLLLFAGSVIAGAALWAGVTWVFGSIAENGLEDFAKSERDEEALLDWQFDFADYRRGFISSETTSELNLVTGLEVATRKQVGNSVPLSHRVFHGPLAMTPLGPKWCSYHVVTTLRRTDLKEAARANLEKMFGGAEPVIVHTTIAFDGSQISRIEVAPWSLEEDGSWKFAGASADLKTGPNAEYVRGNCTIGAFSGSMSGQEDLKFEILALTGEIDYVTGTHLRTQLNFGGFNVADDEIVMSMKSSAGELDFARSHHLDARLDLGVMKLSSKIDERQILVGPGAASINLKRISDAFDLLFGELKLHLDRIAVNLAGEDFEIEDFVIRIDSGDKGGKLYGLAGQETGAIRTSPTIVGAIPAGTIMAKGMKTEIGVEGFDLPTIETLVEKGKELSGLESGRMPETLDSLGNALAENNPETAAFLRAALDLVQPGLEIYFSTALRGADGESSFEMRLGMGGDTKLTDKNTPREVLASIKGNALLRLNRNQYPPELFHALIAEGPAAAFLAEHPDHLEFKGELQEGNLYVNGEAMPLLDELGPKLDEAIDWEGLWAEIGGSAP